MPWKAPLYNPTVPRREADRAYDRGRVDDTARRIRSTQRWKDVRLAHLTRSPLCVDCKARGYTRAATQVDHVIPIAKRPDLAYDDDNLASVCTSCHAVRSQAERAGRAKRTGAP